MSLPQEQKMLEKKMKKAKKREEKLQKREEERLEKEVSMTDIPTHTFDLDYILVLLETRSSPGTA